MAKRTIFDMHFHYEGDLPFLMGQFPKMVKNGCFGVILGSYLHFSYEGFTQACAKPSKKRPKIGVFGGFWGLIWGFGTSLNAIKVQHMLVWIVFCHRMTEPGFVLHWVGILSW